MFRDLSFFHLVWLQLLAGATRISLVMANPNPRLENLRPFTTDKEESCTAQMNVRVPPSLIAKIKQKDNWQEFVRQTLKKALESESV